MPGAATWKRGWIDLLDRRGTARRLVQFVTEVEAPLSAFSYLVAAECPVRAALQRLQDVELGPSIWVCWQQPCENLR